MDSKSNSLTIEDLFNSCDSEGSGFIGPNQFSVLCSKFGIDSHDSQVIFLDLDYDGDGQINFQDFKYGFRDYLTPGSRRGSFQVLGIGNCGGNENNNCSGSGPATAGPGSTSVIQQLIEMERKHESAKSAWEHLVTNVGESKLVTQLIGVKNKFEKPITTELERTLLSLISDVQNLHEETKNLENSFRKERESHASQLAALGEELDSQLTKVRLEASAQLESERKKIASELSSKLNLLNLQLQNFEKVESWLINEEEKQQQSNNNNESNNHHYLLENTKVENHKLRSELFEAQLQARVLQNQLCQKKSEYLNLYKEFHFEKVASSEYKNQVDLMQNHLSLLSETNRVLSDANDVFLSTPSPFVIVSGEEDFVDLKSQNTMNRRMMMTKTKIDDPTNSSFCSNSTTINSIQEPEPESGLWTGESSNSSSNTSLISEESLILNNSPLPQPLPLPHRTFKIILAGDSGVGKTSFIERACHGHWVSHLSSTIGLDFKVKSMEVDGIGVILQLWDTAGQERFHSLTKSYFRRADGVLLMYDVTNEKSFLNIRHWITNIEEGSNHPVPIVICANKIDLRPKTQEPTISTDQGLSLAQTYGALFIEISPKSGYQITETLVLLTREMSQLEDAELTKVASLHRLQQQETREEDVEDELSKTPQRKKSNTCCTHS